MLQHISGASFFDGHERIKGFKGNEGPKTKDIQSCTGPTANSSAGPEALPTRGFGSFYRRTCDDG